MEPQNIIPIEIVNNHSRTGVTIQSDQEKIDLQCDLSIIDVSGLVQFMNILVCRAYELGYNEYKKIEVKPI